MRREIQSIFFFPAFAREFIGGVDLFFLRDDHPSLFLCAAEHSRGRSGFPKRALFVRERERDKRMMWFPISPGREKREREDQTLDLSPNYEKKCEKRGKKKRIDSQNITYRRKKEKELKRKRERKRVFF